MRDPSNHVKLFPTDWRIPIIPLSPNSLMKESLALQRSQTESISTTQTIQSLINVNKQESVVIPLDDGLSKESKLSKVVRI